MDKFNQKGSRIAELIEKGREQGYLTYADVNDHLPDDISDPDQVNEIIGMINDLGLQESIKFASEHINKFIKSSYIIGTGAQILKRS